jgi:hypothetical protein
MAAHSREIREPETLDANALAVNRIGNHAEHQPRGGQHREDVAEAKAEAAQGREGRERVERTLARIAAVGPDGQALHGEYH